MSNYIIFDLEWNQASTKDKEVKSLMFEILQIGAVKLSSEGEVIDTYTSFVKPKVYKKIHDMTQKIVHFDIEELKKERPFDVVAKEFLEWCGNDYEFGIWGTSDLTVLQNNLRFYKLPQISFGPLKYYDVQKLFSIKYEDGKLRRNLEFASEYLNISGNEDFHSAMADADYTAKIFKTIIGSDVIRYYSFDNYYLPKSFEEEIHAIFPTYTKYISRVYRDKKIAMRNSEVSSLRCNKCAINCKRIIKWFTPNSGRYFLCLGVCSRHGFIKAKARIKKAPHDRIYVIKTIKNISEETANEIISRYEKSK